LRIISHVLPGGAHSYCRVSGNQIIDAGDALRARYPDLKALLAAGAASALNQADGAVIDLTDATFLPTVPNPDKIISIGLNYMGHIKETGRAKPTHPSIFTRYPQSFVGHGQPMVRPKASDKFDYEGELAIVIGKAGRAIPAGSALKRKGARMPKAITDVAIIGGGPVGLTAANLLGIDCTLFERNKTTSFHPRGHVINTRTMEILRLTGLEEDVNNASLPIERLAGIGFFTSLAGDKIGVIETRSDPEWRRIEQSQSPSLKRSCPQGRFEPILREHAERYESVSLNFNCDVKSLSQNAGGVDLEWQAGDGTTGKTRARYVIAADGPRSKACEAVGITMQGKSIGQQIGIYFHADLWALVRDRPYLLYWIFNAKTSGVLISLDGRHRWTYNFGYGDSESREDFTEARCLELLQAVIGISGVDIEIKNIMPWHMQARIADQMSAGRVFIAGDAAHPLPPTGGQGMNTGIIDVQNLAWKLDLVLKGKAPQSLLSTYTTERRPVARFNVEQSARNAQAMARKGLSGMLANDSALLANLEGPEGAANRAKLAEGIPEQRAFRLSGSGIRLLLRIRSDHPGRNPCPGDRGCHLYAQCAARPSCAPSARAPHRPRPLAD